MVPLKLSVQTCFFLRRSGTVFHKKKQWLTNFLFGLKKILQPIQKLWNLHPSMFKAEIERAMPHRIQQLELAMGIFL